MGESERGLPGDLEAQWRATLVDEYLREKGVGNLRPALRKQLELIAQGHLAAKEAAEASGLTPLSVSAYRSDLYGILRVEGKEQIVQDIFRIAIQHLGTRQ